MALSQRDLCSRFFSFSYEDAPRVNDDVKKVSSKPSRKLIVAPIFCFQSYDIESSSFSYWLFKISLNCAKFQQDWKTLILNTYVGPGGIFIKKWKEFASQFPLCLSSIRRRKEIQYCVCCYVLDVNALPFFIHYKQDWRLFSTAMCSAVHTPLHNGRVG